MMKRRRSLRIGLENTHRYLKVHVLERTSFPKLLMSFSFVYPHCFFYSRCTLNNHGYVHIDYFHKECWCLSIITMSEPVERVTAPPVVVEEKKEKKSKKEKKEAVPEPEYYIPLEEREAAFEEMKGLFDLSIKKKSRKRSAANNGSMGAEGDGRKFELIHN